MQGPRAALFSMATLTLALAAPVSAEPAEPAEPPPLVVIDPGHGGTHRGAPTVHPQVFEKHLALAVAFELRRELEARGLRAVLTRDRDEYLTLRQRSDLANRVGADFFVSVHGNATSTHSHAGYETFVLPPAALAVDAPALRMDTARSRPGVAPEVARLLDQVERDAAHDDSVRLAAAIQRALRGVRGPEGDRGVRQASQHVLLGATMPAVLVEVGFVDHPIEGAELLEAEERRAVAAAIADAIASQAR